MLSFIVCTISILLMTCCGATSHQQGAEATIASMAAAFDDVKPDELKIVEPIGNPYGITIRSQDAFNNLNNKISEAISSGETNIHVRLEGETFRFTENHLFRQDENEPNVSITIVGSEDTVLTSDSDQPPSPTQSPWLEMQWADEQIEVVDKRKKLCKIPYKNRIDNKIKTHLTKVQITQWFRAPVYKVQRIDDSGVYFIASDLAYITDYKRSGYNVNYDYIYREKKPRFRLYDSLNETKCKSFCSLT